jgi:hypothetical protein
VRRDRNYIAKQRKLKAHPKSKPQSKRPPKVPKIKKVQDKAPCGVCELQLWEHPRCIDCGRFMWCTDQTRLGTGELMHAHGCPT